MSVDLSQCEIRTPVGQQLTQLYRFLMEQFPPDRPLLQAMIDAGREPCPWTPLALYQADELLGNAALVPMRIWLYGRIRDVVGLASVATEPRYRRLGVARRLIEHCLQIVDRQGLACVLFTSLPRVYQSAGFRPISQDYVGTSAGQLRFRDSGSACRPLEELDEAALAVLARIYGHECPAYTGKVERDPQYWGLYQLAFDANTRATIVLCEHEESPRAYARCEREADRLLVSELCADPLCADPREGGILEALFARVADEAQQAGIDWVTLALPRDHFARRFLHDRRIDLQSEPPGAPRETFMVRPHPDESLDPWTDLEWSLADKF